MLKLFTRAISLLIVTQSFLLLADEEATHDINFEQKKAPWFTGPLITPSAYTVKPHHANIEPYLYLETNTGSYGSDWKAHSGPKFHKDRLQVQAKVGITSWMDCQFYPQVQYNNSQGYHSTNVGDMPIGFNFQLLTSKVENPWPSMKLTIKGNVPFGKYDKLNPTHFRTDSMGSGCWFPGTTLVIGKLVNPYASHYLDLRFAVNYQVGVPVQVKGYNTYGGATDTAGTVLPGNLLGVNFAIQYSFTQQFAFAADLIYNHTNQNRFSGNPGTTSTGTPAKMTRPSTEQWSVAPALEYNWSKNLGIIGGVWFTFAGRNSGRFTNGVVAINIYI
jgi:hypothetical protein